MKNKPTYFEMPTFDIPPNTLVKLGQIIHDFSDPTSVVAPPPTHPALKHIPEIYTSGKTNWASEKKKLFTDVMAARNSLVDVERSAQGFSDACYCTFEEVA